MQVEMKESSWGHSVQTKLMIGVLLLALSIGNTKSALANSDPIPSEPTWRQAIAKINAARDADSISVDEAAVYRLWAISDLDRLPAEFLPTIGLPEKRENQTSVDVPSHDGLGDLALKLDALFADQDEWSLQARAEIMDFFDESSQRAEPTQTNLTELELTPHFAIHWTDQGDDAPPDGATYIQAIANSLEDAWDALVHPDHEYEMPDPTEFGRDPNPDDGIARFDVFISRDIRPCGVRIDAGGVSLPGEIRLLNDTSLQRIPTLTAHELFHMLQWNYAGFKNSNCYGMLDAYLWYSSDSAWLMESTSTWIEDEIYPADNDYMEDLADYLQLPEISLFFRNFSHEYGAVVFVKFLQEHLAGPAGYGSRPQDIVRDTWERVPLEFNSTVDALNYVLMNPPSGQNPYSSAADMWESIFNDFAVANYLKKYDDGPQWPLDAVVIVADTQKPIASPTYPVTGNQPGFGWPAAQYIEVFPDDLNLPGGPDATGATLQLDISTDCPRCTLDVLEVGATGGPPLRTTYELEDTGQQGPAGPIIGVFEDISFDFGAPGGTEQVVLVFVDPYLDLAFPWEYEYTFTAIDNPPRAPEDLEAFADEFSDLIELIWDEVQEDDISYRVYRDTNSPVPLDDDHLIAIVQDDGYDDTSISPNIEYYYVVTAVDDGGNESNPSNESSALLPGPTPTPPPSGTTITVQISQGVDDAGNDPHSACAYSISWNEVYFGECFDGSNITSGFRFGGVQIPQGAQIQSAHLNFTVDGPYANPLTLRIRGEDTGNAGSFNLSRRPDNVVLTSSSAPWIIPSSDTWDLGDERQTPDLTAIIQEIVDRSDWSPGGGIAIVVQDDGDAGSLHRRVVGFERPPQTYSGHLAQLVVNYAGNPPPGVTLTPTPIPSPSATPTPPATPTPRPCECAILCLVGGSSSSAQIASPSTALRGPGLLSVLVPQAQELWDGVELLQQVRDQILVKSPEGSRYFDLYKGRSPELALILLADSELRAQGFEAIDLFRPGFEALLEGHGDEVGITSAQVSAVEQFLDEVAAVASPELAKVIAEERAAKPLGQLLGMTMAEGLANLTDNQPPEADAGTGYVVEEGDYIDLLGAGNDPEGDPLTFEWDLNDDGRYDVTGQSVVFSAVGLDGPSIQLVTLRVCDDKAGCAVSGTTVQILNSAPLVAVHEPIDGNEGDPIAFNGIFLDYGTDTHVIEWDFGDGSNAAGSLEPEHIFSDDGVYQITLSVTDDDGGTGSDSVSVTIANAPPALGEITPSDVPVQVGIPVAFSATISDPGSADTHSGTWDWGDGTVTDPATVVDDAAGRRVEDSHIYDLPGNYTIQMQISDDDGAVDTKDLAVQIESNSVPVADAGGPYSVSEGGFVVLSASDSSDPDGDLLTFSWDLNEDSIFETPGATPEFSSSDRDGPDAQLVTLQVCDDHGACALDTAVVAIHNVPPVVGAIGASSEPVQVGTSLETSASFSDAGLLDTHQAVWDWGDGTASSGTAIEIGGSGTVSGAHEYSTTGVFTITLTVTDDDGGSGQSTFKHVIVYDPNAGFVTGGGWINSPTGAYAPDPALAGKANFGFVSKYKKGASVPVGQTEFQLRMADLNFHSDSYEWLVVAGSRAIYKGTGTINGQGEYRFMLTAIDADVNPNDSFDVDRFRIRIWTEDTQGNETEVYDNELGGDVDDSGATSEIGGGSIVIHMK